MTSEELYQFFLDEKVRVFGGQARHMPAGPSKLTKKMISQVGGSENVKVAITDWIESCYRQGHKKYATWNTFTRPTLFYGKVERALDRADEDEITEEIDINLLDE